MAATVMNVEFSTITIIKLTENYVDYDILF